MLPAAPAGGHHRPLQQQRGDAGRVHILAHGTKPAQADAGRPRRPQRIWLRSGSSVRSITVHYGNMRAGRKPRAYLRADGEHVQKPVLVLDS